MSKATNGFQQVDCIFSLGHYVGLKDLETQDRKNQHVNKLALQCMVDALELISV